MQRVLVSDRPSAHLRVFSSQFAMRPIYSIPIAIGLTYLAVTFFLEARSVPEDAPDQSKTVMMFLGFVLTGAVGAILIAITFLPAIGDWVGNLFFNPDTKLEKSPHSGALAAMARGDFQAAVQEYQKCYAEDPTDTHSIAEAARLQCEKLGDVEGGIAMLDEALAGASTADALGFLGIRMADLVWKYTHDLRRSRELLYQVTAELGGTRYAANATHRLQEIEREASMAG